MRILIAFGTRPEFIKLAPVLWALQRTGVDLDVFWSGSIELAVGLLELFKITVTYNGSHIANETGLAGKFGLIMVRSKTYSRQRSMTGL